MKLFSRRRSVDASLPPEIQAYAVAEQRERRGMAWVVGILSLLTTVLVLVVLFFGGRWAYRKITGKSDTKPAATQTTDQKKPADKPAADTNKPTGTTATPDGAASTSTPVQAPAATQPATGDNGSETLVRTGPDVDL